MKWNWNPQKINWNNWNWNAELPPCLLLLSKACGEATRYLYEFFGSPTAEIIACEVFVEVRQQKLRLEISAAKLLNQKAV